MWSCTGYTPKNLANEPNCLSGKYRGWAAKGRISVSLRKELKKLRNRQHPLGFVRVPLDEPNRLVSCTPSRIELELSAAESRGQRTESKEQRRRKKSSLDRLRFHRYSPDLVKLILRTLSPFNNCRKGNEI